MIIDIKREGLFMNYVCNWIKNENAIYYPPPPPQMKEVIMLHKLFGIDSLSDKSAEIFPLSWDFM